MDFISFFSKILDYLYYRSCYICSKKVNEISICEECKNKIYSEFSFSKNKISGIDVYTGAVYEGDLMKIIRALKYHRKKEFDVILADIILETIKNYKLDLYDFVICPVPIHKNRMKKRRYNHMKLVAKRVAQKMNLKVGNLLERVKDTAPLYKLTIPERKRTIDGAFFVSDEIKGQKVLLIDDIVTSGTTIRELSEKILEKQPKQLVVISATRSKSFI